MLFGVSATFAAETAPAPAAVGPTAIGNAKAGEGAGEKTPAGDDITLTLKVPAFSPRFSQTPVALVNDDPILLDEFVTTLEALHEGGTGGRKAGKTDFDQVLNRLINARLILQEGLTMGLDELPEAKRLLADFKESSLREVLKRRLLKDLTPDPEVVKEAYRQLVREWKIRSVKFDGKEAADAFAKGLAGGGEFAALADKLIDDKKAEGGKTGEYVKPQELLPQIAAALAPLKAGEATPVIPVGTGFTVVKLEEIRYPEGNAAAMAEARARATDARGTRIMNEYWEGLKKKQAKINRKLIDKLDFEAPKPGFKKLLKDKRVIVAIKGEQPITVALLAEEMQKKFFHGVDEAIRVKKVNEGKYPAIEDMLLKRLFRQEALRQGIDKSDDYRQANSKYKESLVFGLFVDKVVVPEIKVTNGDVQEYYTAHLADYSTPAMVKLKALAFGKQGQAEAAIEKLRKGAEFQWLQANAEGLVPAQSPGLMEFEATPVITRNLPEKLQQTIDGAKPGDFRLYASPEGYSYAVQVLDVINPQPSPLEKERKAIAQKLFGEKIATSVEEWGAKLRAASSVKIYLADQGR